jgi:hypothetical protein
MRKAKLGNNEGFEEFGKKDGSQRGRKAGGRGRNRTTKCRRGKK